MKVTWDEWIRKRGYASTRELEQAAGLSQGLLSHYINGRYRLENMRAGTLRRLAECLGESPATLIETIRREVQLPSDGTEEANA